MPETDEQMKQKNRELCEQYPFLIPSNPWSGRRVTEADGSGDRHDDQGAIPEYDYEYTVLDSMPTGWRIAFGEQLCEELKNALLEDGVQKTIDEYRVIQIKEKWGFLHWYDAGNTSHGYEVIGKYEDISKAICICCGKHATRISKGWISPFCDDCAKETNRVYPDDFWPIEEFYSKEDMDSTAVYAVPQ